MQQGRRAAPTASLAQDPAFITIGSGPQGGFDSIVASTVADILGDAYPTTTIDVQPGGQGPNILRLSKGQIDLGLMRSNNAADAMAVPYRDC